MTELRPLGVGVIGCGNIAARMHVPAWQELGELVRVVAIADPDPTARERVRALLDLPEADVHIDASELIARPDVDLLDICTPQAFRREVLLAGARSGKDILCEKPLATTPADATAAVEAAAASGTMLAIVHNYLTLPEIIVAKQVIDSGEIGTVRSVVVNMLGVVYEAGAAGDWRRDPALAGGGVLMDLNHGVYLAEALVGEPIRRASAHISAPDADWYVEDLAACVFETDSRVAMVNIGWGFGPGGIHATGSKGRIDIRYEDGGTPPWANLEHVHITTGDGTRQLMGPATDRREGLGEFPSHAVAFRHIASAFAAAAHGRGQPIATGADGLRALEAVTAAYVSATTGQSIAIPLDPESAPFQRGAVGVPEVASVDWSPFSETNLFRQIGIEKSSS